MANILEFTEPADLIAKYDELKTAHCFFIMYLTGGEDPNTGVNWCPDCVAAKPAITEKILGVTQLPVLKGVVIDKTTWCGVATHPYKVHPVLKAGGVPSVMLVINNQVMVRAESGDDFANEDLLNAIATGE